MYKNSDIYCDYCRSKNIPETKTIKYHGGYNDSLLFDKFELCPECMKKLIEKGLDDCYYVNEVRNRIERNQRKYI